MGRVVLFEGQRWRGVCTGLPRLSSKILNLICKQSQLGEVGIIVGKQNL